VYDMYPAWDEPAETAAPNGNSHGTGDSKGLSEEASNGAKPSTRVEHIRRRAPRPGTSPALRAVQASLDRRDNGGDALRGGDALNGGDVPSGGDALRGGDVLSVVASQAPANPTRQ